MRKVLKWLFIVAIAISMLICISASAESGSYGNNLTWTLENGILTISGSGSMRNSNYSCGPWGTGVTSAVIESGVTSIGNSAFYGCSYLTSVTIPESVTSIGDSAFYGCSGLTNVTIAESVTSIGDSAFYGCSGLTSVTIAESVTSIGDSAFYGCSSLMSVTIPEGVTSTGNFVFYDCSNLTSVTIPGSLTGIGAYNFYNCSSLKSVTISQGVKAIGGYAFSNCSSLESVTIPEGVTGIGVSAFSGCSSLTSVTIPESMTIIIDNVFYNCSVNEIHIADIVSWLSISYGNASSHPNGNSGIHLYLGENELTSLEIPAGATSIPSYAFAGFSYLTSVTIPNGVTSIGNYAFSECGSLESVTIPEGVGSIGEWAFIDCTSLASMTIPEGVTSIGNWAFRGCSSLESMTIPNGVTGIGKAVLAGCSGLESVTIPNGVTEIGEEAFSGCSSLESVTIPRGVTNIGDSAFCGCSSLASVTIPEGVTSIGDSAFQYCNVSEIHIADVASWMSISYGNDDSHPNTNSGTHLYLGENELTNLKIPAGVTSISSYAFFGFSSLESVTIPEGVMTIGGYAFCICRNLVSVTILGSVTSIGNYAFCECSSLASVTIPNGVTSIGEEAFSYCISLESVTISNGVTSIGDWAFCNCSNLASVTIPKGVEHIGRYAFSNCSNLASVTIPASVTNIGEYAFSGCSNMTRALFQNQQASGLTIGEYPFNGETTVYCYEFSAVERWATDRYPVVLLDNISWDDICSLTLEDGFRLACGKSRHIAFRDLFPTGTDIMWSSSDDSIVTVSDGLVTANALGTAVITATVGKVSDTVTITTFTGLQHFDLNVEEEWLVAKETIKLDTENWIPVNAEEEFVWSSSDSSAAMVDTNGLVTTKFPEDVIIRATGRLSGLYRETILHVCYPVSAIKFNSDITCVSCGREAQLTANVTMRSQSCVNHLVMFSSSDESVAVVDQHGVVMGIAPGQVLITATASSGVSASIELEVWDACYIEDGVAYEHNWGNATYTWPEDYSSVTATRFCTLNGDHKQTETVETNETIIQEPTCEGTGLANYVTKPFTNTAFEEQRSDNIVLFALGHSWGSPSYVWAEDRSAVTATRICERDTGHTETEEAGTYRTVASTPTDKDPGTISWVSREFKNEAFTVQTIDGGKMNIFRLPSALRTIEAEALAGVSADAVIVPDGCTVIETGAFANCPNLLYISVPSGVTVPEEATAGSADVMVEQRQY